MRKRGGKNHKVQNGQEILRKQEIMADSYCGIAM